VVRKQKKAFFRPNCSFLPKLLKRFVLEDKPAVTKSREVARMLARDHMLSG